MIRVILIVVTTLLIIYLWKSNTRRKFIGVFSSVWLSVILYYFIVPIIILSMKDTSDVGGYVTGWLCKMNYQSLFITYGLILSFLVPLSLVYSKKTQKNKNLQLNHNGFYKKSNTWGILTLFIGGVSLLLYIRAFGGLNRLLSYAEYLRSFSTSGGEFVSYENMILIIPARLVTVAPVLLLLAFSLKNYKEKTLYGILLGFSIILAFIFYLINAGRTGLILYLLMFLIPVIVKWSKHPYLITFIIAFVGIPILDTLDTLFISFSTGDRVSFEIGRGFTDYINQFAYPIHNAFYCNDIVSRYGLRFGKDFILGPLTIIPGFNYDPSYVPVSEFHSGIDWKSGGGTPVDIVTFGYMQFGFIGPLIMGLLLGYLVALLDVLLQKLQDSFYTQVFKAALMVSAFSALVNFDIAQITRTQFVLTILCVLLLLSRAKKKEVAQK